MANINLNNYYRNRNIIKSPVDSKIQLNKKQVETEYYGDLKLDLQFSEVKEKPLNAKEAHKDLQRTINEESVLVSLRNIFNTYKGSRLLNPDMAFEIKQYLFEPLSIAKAWFLGYDICQTLPLYEPRITISEIKVEANIKDNSYTIKLRITIPSLNKDVNINSILTKDGYTILG